MSFKFEHSKERDEFIKKRGKVLLSACPGSGKTTVLAYKLLPLIEEVNKKYGGYAGVLCLSFTNVAKEEILEKYRLFSGKSLPFPSEVSTINSFINTHITLPFYRSLLGKEIRPQIVEDENFNKMINRHIPFRKYLIGKTPIYYKYAPSKFKFDKSGQLVLSYSPSFKSKSELEIFNRYSKELKNIQLSKGIFKNDDSVFIALKILEKLPRLGILLIKRFPYVLVDEAQDTSEEQYALFEMLLKAGLDGMEIVGDHHQAIYEWRDAQPDKFVELMKSKQWQQCELSECRRSNQSIVDVYSSLRSAESKSITSSSKELKVEKPVQVILFDEKKLGETVKLYEKIYEGLDSNVVLTRGVALRNKLTGTIGGQPPWKSPIPALLLSAKELLDKGKIKAAVNLTRSIVPRIEKPDILYQERKKQERELKGNYELNASLLSLLKKIPSTQLSLSDWTSATEKLINASLNFDIQVSFDLKKGIWMKKHKLPLAKVLGKEQATFQTEVSTIHGVKGMTLDSILLILNSSSSGASLSTSDYFSPKDMSNEKQRLLYVAMSRPRHLLMLAIPRASCSKDEAKKLFGKGVKIHEV